MSFQKIDHTDDSRPEGKTCILVHGYKEEELAIIRDYSKVIGILEVISVTDDLLDYTLDELIHQDIQPKSNDHTHSHAIVLNAVSSSELNNFVHSFRTLGLSRPLFAMVTPTSITWTFKTLIKDLEEERAMFEKMRAAKDSH